MCFYNDDYEWVASIHDITDWPFGRPGACFECGVEIGYGDLRRQVFQQQHEECIACEWEEAEEPCETHDYGETFRCMICESCVKILRAIESVEIDNECPPHARQPMFGELPVVFQEHDDAERYTTRAILMFPGLLKSSRLLQREIRA